MNWVIPLISIASISVVVVTAVITIITLRDSPNAGTRRDLGLVVLLFACRVLQDQASTYTPVQQVFLLGKSTLEIHPVTSVHAAVLCYYRSTLSAYDGLSLLQEICRDFIDDLTPPNLDITIHPRVNVTLRPQSTDHPVFLQVYCGGDFGFMAQLAKYMPTNGPITFLDAGANIGMASLLFAQLIMGNGQVISVEANPETAQVLKSNVASLTHVIVPVHAAVVDTATAEGQKTLTLKGRGSEYWGFRVDHNGRKQEDTVTYEVETRTLAQIQSMATTKKLDFIKLDVEGEEKWLLKDPQSREVLCSAICIFMELHERMEQGCLAAFQDFMKAGCEGEQMEEVTRTGEYILVCHKAAQE